MRQLHRIIVRPEMDKEHTRLIPKHMIVQSGHLDAVAAQCGQHRCDFTGKQHEIARDCRLAAAGG